VYYSGALGIVLSKIIDLDAEPRLEKLVSVMLCRMESSAMKAQETCICKKQALLSQPGPRIKSLYKDFRVLSDKQLFNVVHFTKEKFPLNSFDRENIDRQYLPIDLYGKLFWYIIDQGLMEIENHC
jgi:hypothetical protein